MKHIPTLTLTALAAAATAQTAPAPAAKQELSYNRVIVSTVNGHSGADDSFSVFGQAKMGAALGGTVYVSGSTSHAETGADTDAASLGYAYGLPSVAGISADLNVEFASTGITLGLRSLVASGIEVGLAYTSRPNGVTNTNDALTVSASYSLAQFVKGLSIHVSHEANTGDSATQSDETTSIGLGYNF